MIHECFTKYTNKFKVWKKGREIWKCGFVHKMSEEDIENELDIIFNEYGNNSTFSELIPYAFFKGFLIFIF